SRTTFEFKGKIPGYTQDKGVYLAVPLHPWLPPKAQRGATAPPARRSTRRRAARHGLERQRRLLKERLTCLTVPWRYATALTTPFTMLPASSVRRRHPHGLRCKVSFLPHVMRSWLAAPPYRG